MSARETLFAALDALVGGERVALLVGDGARPVELALTGGAAAALRAAALREVQLMVHALPPDEDGYAPRLDAAACYEAALAAKKGKST